MINKLKIGFLVAVLSLAVGVGSAHAAAITWTSDSTITVNGDDYTIATGSSATSMVIDTTTVTFVMPNASFVTLSSAGGHTLANTNGSTSVDETCDDGESTITYTSSGTTTLTVTPSAVLACESSGTGGGSSHHSSGGGGGSGSSSSNAAVATSATPGEGCAAGDLFSPTTGKACPVSATIAGCGQGNMFSPVTGQACATNTVTLVLTPPGAFGYNFGTVTLKNGSRGEAVKELQRFLNATLNLGLVVDGILGPKTIAVIKTWQAAHHLVADGLIGPKTKAMMNASVTTQ